ncbi:MAG: hypothetical protein ABIQ90_02705 [Polaromonas sp.]
MITSYRRKRLVAALLLVLMLNLGLGLGLGAIARQLEPWRQAPALPDC